jgi:tRNA A22 N-methylase
MLKNIFKKTALVFSAFFTLFSLQAQTTITGKIMAPDAKPLENVNVLLLNVVDSGLIKGDITNMEGKFSFQNITDGKYLISCSYAGFETQYLPEISITQTPLLDIGLIHLQTGTINLTGVSVTAKKPLFEQKIDRMIVNVKNSITSAGSTVLDVLQKSPGVIVNKQGGTIAMNGKNGVNVMINGKLNYMPADALVQMLNGMSANNVERIELITTPPAKYDASGNAGYINIVLINNPDIGFNGTYALTLAAFRGTAPAANLDFNYRTQKGNLYASYSFLRQENIFTPIIEDNRKVIYQGKTTETGTRSDRSPVQRNHNIRIGYDYQLGKKTTLGFLTAAYNNKWTMDAVNNTTIKVNNSLDTIIRVNNDEINQWKHWMGNINLQHIINSGEEITFNADYLFYADNNPNNYLNQYYNRNSQLLRTENTRSGKKTVINILPVQIDYKKKLSVKTNLETGMKRVASKFSNDVSVQKLIQNAWKSDSSLTALYSLKENISAAYASMNIAANEKTSIKAGLRYEYITSNLGTETQKNIVDRKYGKLFPTFYLSHKLNDNNSVNFSYNRRINRPAFTDLAPFTIFLDPYTFVTGNSALQPAIADAVKIDYLLKRFVFSLSYTNEFNSIGRYQSEVDVSSNKQIVTAKNLKNTQSINASFSLPMSITKWWFSQINLNNTWQKIETDYNKTPISVSNINYNVSGFQSFTLPQNFGIEISGFYQSKALFGASVSQPFGQLNAGVQKKFKKSNSSLKFGVDDIFSSMNFRSRFDLPEEKFYTFNRFQISRRIFKVTYTKSFGNKLLKEKRARITASEEERGRVK